MTTPSPPPPPAAPPSALHQLIRAQSGAPTSDATAYLRGGAHIDPAFRDAVIEELVEHPYRVPPPSFGVDLIAVVKECFAARRQALLRAALLLAIPVVLSLLSPLPLSLLLTVVLLRVYYVAARKLTGWLDRVAARIGGPGMQQTARVVVVVIWLGLAFYLLFLVVAALLSIGGIAPSMGSFQTAPDYSYGGYSGSYGGYSSHSGYGSCCQSSSQPDFGLWPVSILLTIAGWTAVAAWDRYSRIRTLHALSKQAPVPADAGRAPIYQRIQQNQAGSDVVYGDYAPFVGAGIEVDRWSFAIELVKDADSTPTAAGEFTAPVVHEWLRRELDRLAGDPAAYPGDRLHGLTVLDYVFKSGFRLGPATDWNGSGPGTAFARMAPYAAQETVSEPGGTPASSWWVDSVDLAAEERLRHYLAVRVNSWNDEVTLTVFVRVQIQGGLLYLENRAFVLPPIAREFHAIDTALPPAGADLAGLVLRSLFSSFGLVMRAVPDLYVAARTWVRTRQREAWYDRMCGANRPVDHGPAYSVRELGAEPRFQQLFQEMDVRRFRKSVSMRTLTAVRAALGAYGFQTGEYDARRSVVVNGDVHGNVQLGNDNSATYQDIATPEPRIGAQRS